MAKRKRKSPARLLRKLLTNDAFRKKYLREWLEKLPEEVKEGERDESQQ